MAACSSPGPAALHSHLLLVDQPGRAVVRRIAAPLPGPRHVLLARRAHRRAGGLDQDPECHRPAFQVDQDRRSDHRPHLPLLLTHFRTGTLAGGSDLGFADDLVSLLEDVRGRTFDRSLEPEVAKSFDIAIDGALTVAAASSLARIRPV